MQPLVSFKPSPYPSSFQMILHLQSFTLCNSIRYEPSIVYTYTWSVPTQIQLRLLAKSMFRNTLRGMMLFHHHFRTL